MPVDRFIAMTVESAPATAFETRTWADLGRDELYDLLTLRQRVFVVEQNCPYLDCDGADARAHHLFGRIVIPNPRANEHAAARVAGDPEEERPGNVLQEMVAYARLFPAGAYYEERSIGRVVTAPAVRGSGLGKALLAIALSESTRLFGTGPVRISAQRYLERFYEAFGFRTVSDVYLEDGIEHVAMVRAA